MSNKKVLIYGVLESKNDLRNIFFGTHYFKKLMKSRKFIEIFYCCMNRLRFIFIIFVDKNHFNKGKYGTT